MDRGRAMSRERVRRCFEARFTAARMAEDYVAAYERLLSGTVRRETGTLSRRIGRKGGAYRKRRNSTRRIGIAIGSRWYRGDPAFTSKPDHRRDLNGNCDMMDATGEPDATRASATRTSGPNTRSRRTPRSSTVRCATEARRCLRRARQLRRHWHHPGHGGGAVLSRYPLPLALRAADRGQAAAPAELGHARGQGGAVGGSDQSGRAAWRAR